MRLFTLVFLAAVIAVAAGLLTGANTALAQTDIEITEKCVSSVAGDPATTFVKIRGTIDATDGIQTISVFVEFGVDKTKVMVFFLKHQTPPDLPTQQKIEDAIGNGGKIDVTALRVKHGFPGKITIKVTDGKGKVTEADPPLPPCSVGGTVELVRDAQPSAAANALADGLNATLLGLLIGGSATTFVVGGWYARRRWVA